jgi:recombination protein RecT
MPQVASGGNDPQALERRGDQQGLRKAALDTVRKLLEQSKAGLTMALPKHIPADYIIRVALTSVQRNPKLLECHPITLIGAVFQAAQLGLVPDGVLGQAYLVPFKNRKKNRLEVQFIPGYKGLIELARRSGELSTIAAEVVHAKDTFKYVLGTTPMLEYVPTDEADPGPLTHVWACARLKDGGYQLVVMNHRQVMAIRARSQSVQAGVSSPWDSDPDWMWKKTAIRQLCKLLPASTELQRAIGLEERAEIGLPQDLSILADPDHEEPTPDDDGADTPIDPVQAIAGDLQASDVDAAAVLAAFDTLTLTPAQRLVYVKQFRGRAADLLEMLRALAGAQAGVSTAAGVANPDASAFGPSFTAEVAGAKTIVHEPEPIAVASKPGPRPVASTKPPGHFDF